MSGRDEGELARLRQRVADLERERLVEQAQRVAPGAEFPAGAGEDEIRAIAVRHAHGVAAIDGESADTIRGYFRALVAMANGDPVRRALRSAPKDARH